MNNSMFRNVRFYVLACSFFLSAALFLSSYSPPNISSSQIAFLTKWYSLTAAGFLYVTLLATPLTRLFITLPFRGQYIKARRAIGVSAFYFGFLHMLVAFFGELGGFSGLSFLDSTYLTGIILSFIALFILLLMSITSTDAMIAKLTFPRWKLLHRFVYLAGVLIIVHAVLLGSDFATFSDPISQISFILLIILFALESLRFDRYLQQKFQMLPQVGVTTLVFIGALISFVTYFLSPTTSQNLSVGIHSQHNLASEKIPNSVSSDMQNMTGMQGDKTLRYSISFTQPDQIQANSPVDLVFHIYDARNGSLVPYFTYVYEKLMHVIIVDNKLEYFSHEHPDFDADAFTLHTSFPHDGLYRIYITFEPIGATEQQFAFTLWVGDRDVSNIAISNQTVDTNTKKAVDGLQAKIDSTNLQADEINTSVKNISFTLSDAQSLKPVMTLEPYLGAFGHLTLINQRDYSFFHFHPRPFTPVGGSQRGGPIINFALMNQYQPLTPGVYRAFAEFKYHDTVRTTDFTLKVN